jgi:hypothetical protein
LLRLGFEAESTDRGVWCLDLTTGLTLWLARISEDRTRGFVNPENPENPANPNEAKIWTRMVLRALENPDQLGEAYQALGRTYFDDPETFRRWIIDAVQTLAAGPDPVLAEVLRRYYVDHQGSHELLAERMNVSRATYFRLHRKAMRVLATQLWSSNHGWMDQAPSLNNHAKDVGS